MGLHTDGCYRHDIEDLLLTGSETLAFSFVSILFTSRIPTIVMDLLQTKTVWDGLLLQSLMIRGVLPGH